MKTRAQALAERKAKQAASTRVDAPPSTPLSLADVAALLKNRGVSLHLSERGGRFLVVAHRASDHKAGDAAGPDLEGALREAMRVFDEVR